MIKRLGSTVFIEFKRLSVHIGLVAGLYLGIKIDRYHFSLELGIAYIDISW